MKKKCKKIVVGCMNSYKKLVGIIKNNNNANASFITMYG